MTDPKYMRPGLPFAIGKATEEMGELLSAIGKSLRWGWHSYNPELPSTEVRETNAEWVRREMKDVRGALDNLEREMNISKLPKPTYTSDEMIQRLYDSEINFSISVFWDGGIDVKLGDAMNGFSAETQVRTWNEAMIWLDSAARMTYPTSLYATGLYPEGWTPDGVVGARG